MSKCRSAPDHGSGEQYAMVLPTWVGMYEANAIALEIEKSATPRPMTHALLNNLVRDLNTSVQKCVLAEFKTIRFTL